ncbi:MAG: InlB B-repeat-containing protein, partial [Clostridia bacterium]|nr:InlB B-repeat-containing protein [Clostridia bacterium]
MERRKSIIFLPIIFAVVVMTVLYFACSYNKYSLNKTEFETVIEYNGDVDLSDVVIYDKTSNKEISLGEYKVVSCDDTSTIGDKVLIIEYKEQQYKIHFTVKYKVEFVVNDTVVDTQYVNSADEIVVPQSPSKDGYEFVAWDKDIPAILNDNILFSAIFSSTELTVPKLTTLTVPYGTTLNEISLPSNKNGRWIFVNSLSTAVGDVGITKFDVKFVPSTNELVEKYDEIEVVVKKKQLEFTIDEENFVYDGKEHFPKYTLPVDVKVNVIGNPETNASLQPYEYALVIDDSNYSGYYYGEFSISKADVLITINNKTVDYGNTFTMNYDIQGFEDEQILGLSITMPSILNAGIYSIGASVTNPNVNLTVNEGVLVIEKIDLNPAPVNPTLSTDLKAAVYGDLLSEITFDNNFASGTWTWKYPNTIIDKIDGFKAVAVFTPKSSNYNIEERELDITNIDKKTLEINIIKNTFTYDGNQHQIEYQIADGSYLDIDVLGNTSQIDADKYSVTLSINHQFYNGAIKTNLTINKATPITDFSTKYTKTWFDGITLEDIKLSSGYVWKNTSTSLDTIETKLYDAQFVPSDTKNYNTVNGQFEVCIQKANASITNVSDNYEFVYNGNIHNILDVKPSHYESDLQYLYTSNGASVASLLNAGEYEIVITLPSSTHYNETQVTTYATIKQASVDVVLQTLTATYEDCLGDINLPVDTNGVWTWKQDLQTSVGDAGTQTYIAIYTPNSNNYQTTEFEATIQVCKKSLSFEIINNTYTYDKNSHNIEYTLVDANGKIYSSLAISGNNAQVNAGTYNLTLNVESDNYSATKSVQLIINKASLTPNIPNNLTAIYLDTLASVELPTASEGAWRWNEQQDTLVGNVGDNQFSATFVYSEEDNCDNYNDYTTKLTISVGKKSVDVPSLEVSSATYTGNTIKAEIVDGDLYFVKTNGWTEVKQYNVELQLNDYSNYIWANGNEKIAYIPFSIEKAQVVISNLEMAGWTYNETASVPSATTNFGTIEYTYSTDVQGTNIIEKPSNAGTYYVIATVEGTDNYIGATAIKEFEIKQAQSVITDFVITGWTYGETANEPSANTNFGEVSYSYATSENGEYTTQKPTTAGTYYVKAEVVGNDNFASSSQIVKIVIDKVGVPIPSIEPKVYTGSNLIADVEDNPLYEIENNGGIEKGTYDVILTLKDFDNYKWVDKDTKSITLIFEIASALNSWKVKPSVTGWTYGESSMGAAAEATFGDVVIEYKLQDTSDDNYSIDLPTDAGNYIVRFSVEGTDDYSALLETLSFTISKASIKLPTVESKVYIGNTLTADVEYSALYKIENNGGVNVGNYPVIFTIINNNYKWESGNETVVTLQFYITQAQAVISDFVMEGWTYGETENNPSASTNFGTIEYTYSTDDEGINIIEKPSDAGTYYVIATVEGKNNYEGVREIKKFIIAKAQAVISDFVMNGWTYGETENNPSASTNFG